MPNLLKLTIEECINLMMVPPGIKICHEQVPLSPAKIDHTSSCVLRPCSVIPFFTHLLHYCLSFYSRTGNPLLDFFQHQ